jgi:transcription antitermination factor NusG
MLTWESDGGSTNEAKQRFWFAVQVRERFERYIENALAGKNIETFVPLVTQRHRWSDRTKELQVPLFAGYVFCRIDPEVRLPVLTVPGVHYFVGIGKAPAPIADEEIESIRALVQCGAMVTPRPFLTEGQKIRVEDGPLQGVEGILIRNKGSNELVVTVTLLQRSVAVTVERDAVVPVKDRVGARPQAPRGFRDVRSSHVSAHYA